MKVRFTYFDSETGEDDTVDLNVDITSIDETSGPAIASAFQLYMSRHTGEEPIDHKVESFVLAGDRAALTFREKVILPRDLCSYDVLITGIVYTKFV